MDLNTDYPFIDSFGATYKHKIEFDNLSGIIPTSSSSLTPTRTRENKLENPGEWGENKGGNFISSAASDSPSLVNRRDLVFCLLGSYAYLTLYEVLDSLDDDEGYSCSFSPGRSRSRKHR
ncbi:hypothetical protein PAAG_11387 [Paracoccidioides lutzii Pb01]|uniref:Uncharacterized protein n=1 Tax=Paracoccidioides lutzii (strain ATCC MYA-826 / Pb01) TaxID=502779 RepID=A0A0A2VLT1_PARBA|nr:hypothetical protein PAAG_11387 [Paracoccidioides lutzii Pb01]KGQ01814.1 hypothetical protein PAAG_11387 [Paracoccidioides lutzii Pb01]